MTQVPEQQAVPVAWRERDGDEWAYYDANSDTGKHIAAHQRERHNVSIFPLFASLPCKSGKGAGEALRDAAERFEAIRLTLIDYLDEPVRSAFWCAVEGKKRADAALTPDATQTREAEVVRQAASLVYRIEASGPIDDERTNIERWKADARALAPDLRAALNARGGA